VETVNCPLLSVFLSASMIPHRKKQGQRKWLYTKDLTIIYIKFLAFLSGNKQKIEYSNKNNYRNNRKRISINIPKYEAKQELNHLPKDNRLSVKADQENKEHVLCDVLLPFVVKA